MARKWAESALKSCLSKGLLRSYIATVHCFFSQIWTGYSKMLLHVCALWQYTAYIMILRAASIYAHVYTSVCLSVWSSFLTSRSAFCRTTQCWPIMVVAFSDPRSAWAECAGNWLCVENTLHFAHPLPQIDRFESWWSNLSLDWEHTAFVFNFEELHCYTKCHRVALPESKVDCCGLFLERR